MNSNKTITIVLVSLLVVSSFIIGYLLDKNFYIAIFNYPKQKESLNISIPEGILQPVSNNTSENNTTNEAQYEVKKGDTLDTIAKLFGTTKEKLMNLNNLKTETIKTGDVIKVSY